jgi:hypothetical protein
MATIVMSDFVTLDGVIQDPSGDEGFSRGGWVGGIKDQPEVGKILLDGRSVLEQLDRLER